MAPMHARGDALPLRHTARFHRCELCFRRPPPRARPQCTAGESCSKGARRRKTSVGRGAVSSATRRHTHISTAVCVAGLNLHSSQGHRVVCWPHAPSNTSPAPVFPHRTAPRIHLHQSSCGHVGEARCPGETALAPPFHALGKVPFGFQTTLCAPVTGGAAAAVFWRCS
jgi:hypothetical protein